MTSNGSSPVLSKKGSQVISPPLVLQRRGSSFAQSSFRTKTSMIGLEQVTLEQQQSSAQYEDRVEIVEGTKEEADAAAPLERQTSGEQQPTVEMNKTIEGLQNEGSQEMQFESEGDSDDETDEKKKATPTLGTSAELATSAEEPASDMPLQKVVSTEFSTNDDEAVAAVGDDDQAEQETAFAPVIFTPFLWKGHIINGIYLFIMVLVCFGLSTPLSTVPKCNLFKTAALIAIVGDILIVQPLVIGFTLAYRWMTTEDIDGKLASELHPLHGTYRQIL